MDDQRTNPEGSSLIATWYEVWADDGQVPPYVLLVVPTDRGRVAVFDPKNGSIAHEASDYETAKLWLLEDEFVRVMGRMVPE